MSYATMAKATECRVVCDDCGRDVFFHTDLLFGRSLQTCGCGTQHVPTRRGVPLHRTQRCTARVTKECEWCGKPFPARPEIPGRFCQQNCRNAARTAERRKARAS